MRLVIILISSVLLFGCAKNNPEPTASTTSEPAPNTNPSDDYLGQIQFDLEVAGTVTHYEYYIDSLRTGGILVDNGQGGQDDVMLYVGPNVRALSVRYFDSEGIENRLSLTETIDNSSNAISILHYGDNPYAAQNSPLVPTCNSADFEISVISDRAATFAADGLYNFYTEETVNVTNGSYILY